MHLPPPLGALGGPAPAVVPDPLIPTVHHEPWWLEIVTGGRWETVEMRENGRVIGRMPYHLTRRLGRMAMGMPPLTHFLGPAIEAGTGSAQARWLKRTAITRELVRALPPRASFWQKFHRGITDVVAFQAEHFTTAVQFTFEVAPAPEETLWKALRDKHRNVIRKARKQFALEEMADSAEFTWFYHRNLQARRLRSWASAEMMGKLLPAALAHGSGTLLGLRDEQRNLVAALFCASDHRSLYYTLSSRTPASGNGAVPWLIWRAIQLAARNGLVFDFDGLSAETSIGLYAGFGGVTSPRYVSARPAASRAVRLVRRGLGLKTNPFGS